MPPNVFEPDFDAEQDEPPFTWRRARLGRQAGAEQLGASLFELPPGELVACPRGRRGAHRIDNGTDEPVRFMVVSTMIAPEVNEYPDSGKIWVRDYAPGAAPPEHSELDTLVPDSPKLHYLDGEREAGP